MAKHILSTLDLNPDELENIFELSRKGKATRWTSYHQALAGKVIGLLFFNPSLRTRASMMSGIARLGGSVVPLASGTETWPLEFRPGAVMDQDKTEHIKDAAKVFSSYFDLLGVRSFPKIQNWEEDKSDLVLNSIASSINIPLVSLESSLWHPCQALADALTLKEQFGADLKKQVFVVSWAPHPKQLPMAVPHSAALIAAQLGMQVRLACPKSYEFDTQFLSVINQTAELSGGSFKVTNSQEEALTGANVVYAKSWTPPAYIGRAQEEFELRKGLGNWIMDEQKMAKTAEAHFMHCLPVRRNVEVMDQVLDSKNSFIGQQVENRMHVQNALLVHLLKGK